MDIPVLLEPTPTGWRATTGAPLNLVAEGPTKEAVLAELQRQIVMLYVSGTRVVSLSVPEPHPSLEIAARMAKNPFMEEWAKGIQEYRAEVNLSPDQNEEVTPLDLNGATHATLDPSRTPHSP